MKNFKDLRSSNSHNALPSYLQPSSYSNISELHPENNSSIFMHPAQLHQSNSSTPLSFNLSTPYKAKLKKGFRPDSRGGNDSNSNHQERDTPNRKHSSSSRNKLDDFSQTTSTVITNWNSFTIQSPEKNQSNVYSGHGQQEIGQDYRQGQKWKYNIPQDLPRPEKEHNKYHNHETTSELSLFSAKNKTPEYNSNHLMLEIENQRKTIDNFQQQILRLNSEMNYFKDSKAQRDNYRTHTSVQDRYDVVAEQNRILRDKNQFLGAQLEKVEKKANHLNQHNGYLQTQCKNYLQSYQRSSASLKSTQDKNISLQNKIQTLERQLNCQPTHDIQGREEVNRLRGLVEAQTNKLQQQQKVRVLDQEEINCLMMKLQALQSKNQQLQQHSNQTTAKWKALFAEHQKEKEEWQGVLRPKEYQWKAKVNRLQEEIKENQQYMVQFSKELAEAREHHDRYWNESQQSNKHLQHLLSSEQVKLQRIEQTLQQKQIKEQQFQERIKVLEYQLKNSAQNISKQLSKDVQKTAAMTYLQQQLLKKDHNLKVVQAEIQRLNEENYRLGKHIKELEKELTLWLNEQHEHHQQRQAQRQVEFDLRQQQLEKQQKEEITQLLSEQRSSLEKQYQGHMQQLQQVIARLHTQHQQIQRQNKEVSSCQLTLRQSLENAQKQNRQLQQTNKRLQKQIEELEGQMDAERTARTEQQQESILKFSQQIQQIKIQNQEVLRKTHQQHKEQVQDLKQQLSKEQVQDLKQQLSKGKAAREEKKKIQRTQLQSVKAENELLRTQVKQLKQQLQTTKAAQEKQEIGVEHPKTAEQRSAECSQDEKKAGTESNYVQVDREGLDYICELLGCQPQSQGILNTIVQSLSKHLQCHQQTTRLASHYLQLLDLYDIPVDSHCNQALLDIIKDLTHTTSDLVQRVNELQQLNQTLEEQKENYKHKKHQHHYKEREKEMQLQVARLEELNHHLNEQIICLTIRMHNFKMGTKAAVKMFDFPTDQRRSCQSLEDIPSPKKSLSFQ